MPISARSTRRNSFTKDERLCSRKAIEALFAGGNKSFTAFPLRVVFRIADEEPSESSVKVLVSVSKRHFKHAVDRNRAKRQVREAWRLNRDILLGCEGSSHASLPALHLAFLWLADEPQPTELVVRKTKNLLHRVAEHISSRV